VLREQVEEQSIVIEENLSSLDKVPEKYSIRLFMIY
jgi:hypothetical protein